MFWRLFAILKLFSCNAHPGGHALYHPHWTYALTDWNHYRCCRLMETSENKMRELDRINPQECVRESQREREQVSQDQCCSQLVQGDWWLYYERSFMAKHDAIMEPLPTTKQWNSNRVQPIVPCKLTLLLELDASLHNNLQDKRVQVIFH